MSEQLALDLRSDAERELAERIERFREHMKQDWRNPGRYLHEHSEWVPVQKPELGSYGTRQVVKVRSRSYRIDHGRWVGDRYVGEWMKDGWRDALRCLRCAEIILPYDYIISHDRGWTGCPGDHERYNPGGPAMVRLPPHSEPEARVRAYCDRADREVFPDCARCGHPWGLHRFMHTGHKPPNMESCDVCVSCRGYIAPAGARTPWGTCPGCWAQPEKCMCVQ